MQKCRDADAEVQRCRDDAGTGRAPQEGCTQLRDQGTPLSLCSMRSKHRTCLGGRFFWQVTKNEPKQFTAGK